MFFTFLLFLLSSALLVGSVPAPARAQSGMECPGTPGDIVDHCVSTFAACVFLAVTLRWSRVAAPSPDRSVKHSAVVLPPPEM